MKWESVSNSVFTVRISLMTHSLTESLICLSQNEQSYFMPSKFKVKRNAFKKIWHNITHFVPKVYQENSHCRYPPPQLLQTLEEGNHYLSYSLSVHAIQPFSLSKRRPITAQTQELKLLGINWVYVPHMHFMAKSFNTVHVACWISDVLIQGFKSPIKCNLKSAFSAVKGKPGAHIFNHDTVYLFWPLKQQPSFLLCNKQQKGLSLNQTRLHYLC